MPASSISSFTGRFIFLEITRQFYRPKRRGFPAALPSHAGNPMKTCATEVNIMIIKYQFVEETCLVVRVDEPTEK
jgi:hypothetical protein